MKSFDIRDSENRFFVYWAYFVYILFAVLNGIV